MGKTKFLKYINIKDINIVYTNNKYPNVDIIDDNSILYADINLVKGGVCKVWISNDLQS